MRLALAALAALAAGPALADPYLIVSASKTDGLVMLDVATVRQVGTTTRAWTHLVLPDRPPQRVFVESNELEFDCVRKRTRLVAGVRYDARHTALATTQKAAAWEPVKPRTPVAEMHRQLCAGAIAPDALRGHGKTVPQFANEMRPFLAKLER